MSENITDISKEIYETHLRTQFEAVEVDSNHGIPVERICPRVNILYNAKENGTYKHLKGLYLFKPCDEMTAGCTCESPVTLTEEEKSRYMQFTRTHIKDEGKLIDYKDAQDIRTKETIKASIDFSLLMRTLKHFCLDEFGVVYKPYNSHKIDPKKLEVDIANMKGTYNTLFVVSKALGEGILCGICLICNKRSEILPKSSFRRDKGFHTIGCHNILADLMIDADTEKLIFSTLTMFITVLKIPPYLFDSPNVKELLQNLNPDVAKALSSCKNVVGLYKHFQSRREKSICDSTCYLLPDKGSTTLKIFNLEEDNMVEAIQTIASSTSQVICLVTDGVTHNGEQKEGFIAMPNRYYSKNDDGKVVPDIDELPLGIKQLGSDASEKRLVEVSYSVLDQKFGPQSKFVLGSQTTGNPSLMTSTINQIAQETGSLVFGCGAQISQLFLSNLLSCLTSESKMNAFLVEAENIAMETQATNGNEHGDAFNLELLSFGVEQFFENLPPAQYNTHVEKGATIQSSYIQEWNIPQIEAAIESHQQIAQADTVSIDWIRSDDPSVGMTAIYSGVNNGANNENVGLRHFARSIDMDLEICTETYETRKDFQRDFVETFYEKPLDERIAIVSDLFATYKNQTQERSLKNVGSIIRKCLRYNHVLASNFKVKREQYKVKGSPATYTTTRWHSLFDVLSFVVINFAIFSDISSSVDFDELNVEPFDKLDLLVIKAFVFLTIEQKQVTLKFSDKNMTITNYKSIMKGHIKFCTSFVNSMKENGILNDTHSRIFIKVIKDIDELYRENFSVNLAYAFSYDNLSSNDARCAEILSNHSLGYWLQRTVEDIIVAPDGLLTKKAFQPDYTMGSGTAAQKMALHRKNNPLQNKIFDSVKIFKTPAPGEFLCVPSQESSSLFYFIDETAISGPTTDHTELNGEPQRKRQRQRSTAELFRCIYSEVEQFLTFFKTKLMRHELPEKENEVVYAKSDFVNLVFSEYIEFNPAGLISYILKVLLCSQCSSVAIESIDVLKEPLATRRRAEPREYKKIKDLKHLNAQ